MFSIKSRETCTRNNATKFLCARRRARTRNMGASRRCARIKNNNKRFLLGNARKLFLLVNSGLLFSSNLQYRKTPIFTTNRTRTVRANFSAHAHGRGKRFARLTSFLLVSFDLSVSLSRQYFYRSFRVTVLVDFACINFLLETRLVEEKYS